MTSTLALAAVILTVAGASPVRAEAAPAPIGGIWDLTWQTRKGPSRKGYLVIEQSGARLVGRIHGQGSVTAKGSIAGSAFTLRGSRLAVPYVISGSVEGGRMTGSLKVLSVERRFTGLRRGGARR